MKKLLLFLIVFWGISALGDVYNISNAIRVNVSSPVTAVVTSAPVVNVTNSIFVTNVAVDVSANVTVTNNNNISSTNIVTLAPQTNQINVSVTSVVESASITVVLTNENTISVGVTNNIASINVDASVIVTNYAYVTNFITVTNYVSIGDTFVTNNVLITNSTIVSPTVVITNISYASVGPNAIANTNGDFATTGTIFIVSEPSWTSAVEVVGNFVTVKGGLPNGASGVVQYAQWDGSKWVTLAPGTPTQPPVAGTNVATFSRPYPITNTWIVPSGVTGAWFRAWGGTGAGMASSGGGYIAGYVSTIPGEIFEIIVGSLPTNAGKFGALPGGGNGGNAGQGGGSYTIIRKGLASADTNDIVLVAGGSGGSQIAGGISGPGGGYLYLAQDSSASVSTNCSPGGGAWALDEYGTSATAGVPKSSTNSLADGSFLQGGNSYTNLSSTFASHCGGGGGWMGGAGSFQLLIGATAANAAAGGGGISYANPNHVLWASTARGTRNTAASGTGGYPAGTEYPSYTAGRAMGSAVGGGNGTAGCAGVEY